MFLKPKIEIRQVEDISFIIKKSLKRKKTVQYKFDMQKKEIIMYCPFYISDKEIIHFMNKLTQSYKKQYKTKNSNKNLLKDRVETLINNLIPEYSQELIPKIQTLTISYSPQTAYKLFGKYIINTHEIILAKILTKTPQYVHDYVLFHEIIHLISLKHDNLFKTLEKRYPQYDKANGFLEAISILGKDSNII